MTSTLDFSYPFFVPNQVLRSEDLNNIVDYLDKQNRLTRSYLFGMGTVFGLDIKWEKGNGNGASKIIIGEGIGLSSKGYLFDIEECVIQSAKPMSIDTDRFLCDKNQVDPGDTISLWELSKDKSGMSVDEMLAKADGEDGMAILLFWDEEQQIRENCFADSDEAAGFTEVVIHKFAMKKADADRITTMLTTANEADPVLPAICLRRFGYFAGNEIAGLEKYFYQELGEGIYPEAVKDVPGFVKNYHDISNLGIDFGTDETIGDLVKAYTAASANFYEVFFGESKAVFRNLRDHLLGNGNTQGLLQQVVGSHYGKGIQYFYDYIKDLVLAYEEFASTKFAEQLWGKPDTCLFPYHVVLGRFYAKNESVKLDQNYRTHLIRYAVGLGDEDFFKARHLFERMIQLTRSRVVDGKAEFVNVDLPFLNAELPDEEWPEIKITPSKGKWFPLSERAIPYYYKSDRVSRRDSSVRAYWSYEAKVKRREEQIPAYYPVQAKEGTPFLIRKDHLLCDMDAYNFFRIEGHLFRNLVDALYDIEGQRKRLNLPFDIRFVRIDDIYSDDCAAPWNCGWFESLLEDLEVDYQKYRHDLLCYIEMYNNYYYGGGTLDGTDLTNFLKEKNSIADFFEDYEEFVGILELAVANLNNDDVRECFGEPFAVLKEAFDKRCATIREQLSFSGYAKLHPGLEHLGGVPKGGTFVLVVTEALRTENRAAVINELRTSIIENNPDVTEDNFDGLAREDAWLICQARRQGFGDLQDWIYYQVIADFCLPYYCCTPKLAIGESPEINMEGETFCEDDDTLHLISGSPRGGQFIREDDTAWLVPDTSQKGEANFIPSEVPDSYFDGDTAELEIGYVYRRRLTTRQVTVYRLVTLTLPDLSQSTGTDASGNPIFEQTGPAQGKTILGVNRVGGNFNFSAVQESDPTVLVDLGDQAVFKENYLNIIRDSSTDEIIGYEFLYYVAPGFTTLNGSGRVSPPPGVYTITYGDNYCVPSASITIVLRAPAQEPGNASFADAGPLRAAGEPTSTKPGKAPSKTTGEKTDAAASTGQAIKTSPPTAAKTSEKVQQTKQVEPTEKPKQPPKQEPKGKTAEAEKPPKSKVKAEPLIAEAAPPVPPQAKEKKTEKKKAEKKDKDDNGFVVFNQRRAARAEELAELEADSTFAQTKTFREAKAFELLNGLDIAVLEERFEEVMNLLINSRSRAKGKRKEQYDRLVVVMLHGFGDKVVAIREDKLPDATRETLETILMRLKSKGVDVVSIGISWNGQELKDAVGAASVDELEALYENA